jgi:hypothetical protein
MEVAYFSETYADFQRTTRLIFILKIIGVSMKEKIAVKVFNCIKSKSIGKIPVYSGRVKS